jgi:Flp pilus assembly protein TadG
MSRQAASSRGQSLTEFALVLPIVAIMLFGVIDLGPSVNTANAMSNGAREGARVGSVGNRPSPTCDGLTRVACVTQVTKDNSWGVPSNAITATVSCERIAVGDPTPNPVGDPNTCRSNDLLKVRAETTFTLVTPIIAQFIGGFTLSGEARVTVNQ